MTPHDAFMAAIVENPSDDVPRLIYADWLEEQGQPERAEFIRVQCELFQLGPIFNDSGVKNSIARKGRRDHPRYAHLIDRERELLEENWAAWDHYRPPVDTVICRNLNQDRSNGFFTIEYQRGFIESVTCLCQQWLDHGPAILAACPMIWEVKISDKKPTSNRFLPKRWAWFHESVPTNANNPDLADRNNDFPDSIFRYLKGGRDSLPLCKWYDSEAEAIADVNQACLAYARSLQPVTAEMEQPCSRGR